IGVVARRLEFSGAGVGQRGAGDVVEFAGGGVVPAGRRGARQPGHVDGDRAVVGDVGDHEAAVGGGGGGGVVELGGGAQGFGQNGVLLVGDEVVPAARGEEGLDVDHLNGAGGVELVLPAGEEGPGVFVAVHLARGAAEVRGVLLKAELARRAELGAAEVL